LDAKQGLLLTLAFALRVPTLLLSEQKQEAWDQRAKVM